MLSTSLGFLKLLDSPFWVFLHGTIWNSFESGVIILTRLATLSLFLYVNISESGCMYG